MPRGFSTEEQDKIRNKLEIAGKTLFGQYGLQKTSIGDLTKNAGIAQGSFYKFYDSKEALFFDLLEKAEAEIKAPLLDMNNPSPEELEKQLSDAILRVRKHPILLQIYEGNTMEALVRKLPEKKITEHFSKDQLSIGEMLKQVKKEEDKVSMSTDLAASLFRALFLLTLHERELGELYEETIRMMIHFVLKGILEG